MGYKTKRTLLMVLCLLYLTSAGCSCDAVIRRNIPLLGVSLTLQSIFGLIMLWFVRDNI